MRSPPARSSLLRPMSRTKTMFPIWVTGMTKHIWFISSLCRHLSCTPCIADCRVLCQWAQSLSLPSTETTWFNFLASHDGIGLNPLRGLLAEDDILTLVTDLQKEGALVNWKNNPDGTRSPYELNVTSMDALGHQMTAMKNVLPNLFSPMFCY